MKSTTTLWRGYLFVVMIWQVLAPVTSLIFGRPPRCNLQCVYDYIPVCGSDGRTYPNFCFLFVASCRNISLTLVRLGPCAADSSRVNPPLGLTPPPPAASTPTRPRAPTPTRPPCPIGCTREYLPVCGSDGVTYPNQCNFNMVACKKDITKVKDDPCGKEKDPTLVLTTAPSPASIPTRPRVPTPTRPPCPIGCTREYLPVCGSDGVTYPNQCNFNMVACKKDITKVKDDPCDQQVTPPTQPRCPLSCNKVYIPLCGSDGITYTNHCVLTKTICKDPSITKRKNGPCESPPSTTPRRNAFIPTTIPPTNNVPNRDFCRKDCPFTYVPLCGTNGVTYTNKCTFDVAVCRNATLKVQYNESCN